MIWKIYFWFFAVIVAATAVGRTAMYFAKPGAVTIYEIFESFPGLGCAIALYGYVFGVSIGTRFIWVVVAVAVPITYLLSLRSSNIRNARQKLGNTKATLILCTAFILTLPAYVGLILYAQMVK